RAADLRFTESETAQFLNEVMGLQLDAAAVIALEQRTEGWIAGLQMAALSMRDREDAAGFIEGFSGTHRYILDYLLEEVLNSQPPEVQDFLLRTSILERLSAPLCAAVLAEATQPGGEHGASAILEHLERTNLFIVPLDDARIWYRYHHLFADLLRARLQQAHPDLIPNLHIRASAWLEEQGLILDALHHFFAAHAFDRAADLVERYGPARLVENDPSIFRSAERLPGEVILARPKIGLYQAWLLIVQGRIVEVRPLLDGLAKQLADQKAERGWMQAYIFLAQAFLAPPPGANDVDLLPDYAMVDAIPAGEPILRNAANFLYGMTLGRRGELARAAEVALAAIEQERASLGPEAIPTLAPFLSRIYIVQGRLHAAAALCRQFLGAVEAEGVRLLYAAGNMLIDLGEVLYEWNDLEAAERHIRDGLEANEIWQNIMTEGFGLVALARTLQAQGAYPEALQVVEQFEAKLSGPTRPHEFGEELLTLRARVQLASGDLQSAVRWADQVRLSEDYTRHEDVYRLVLARVRLAQGRYAEVETMLAGTVPPEPVGSWVSRQIETDLLLAAAVAGQQRQPEALALLAACLERAAPEGYVRVFLDVGEPVRELLTAYLRSDAPKHEAFARQVLAAFPASGEIVGISAGGLIEPLSERELEVLQLMALGNTNKQVAAQLIISPGTVKAHTASIYRKLDVANRTEAVTRARQRNILS
ncbi:MAG: hypothetical protein JXB38_19640, partial [Anaerolineales bacterium]|nr:hypothetical protein [Anaerolineales bacterium]